MTTATKTLLAALASALLASSGLLADSPGFDIDLTFTNGPPPAMHPTALMTTYEGHDYRIVSVDGTEGRIERDGKLRGVRPDAKYQAVRAKAFLPGSIRVVGDSASSNMMTGVIMFSNGDQVKTGSVHASSDFVANLIPTADYPQCYLALVFFDQAFLKGDTDSPGFALAFKEIGDLKAGVKAKVDASFGYIDFNAQHLYYVPLFFSHGSEIRSNFSDAVARVFKRVEMIRHQRILDAYRAKNPKATLAEAPYQRFPFVFPEGFDYAKVPPTVKIDFTVNEDGTIEDVSTPPGIQGDLRDVIHRTVGDWLFMPKLVEGFPRRTFNSMVIKFADSPAAAAPPAK